MNNGERHLLEGIQIHQAGDIGARLAGEKTKVNNRDLICFHEASHAVTMVVFARPIWAIVIECVGGFLSGCVHPSQESMEKPTPGSDEQTINADVEILTLCARPPDLPGLTHKTEQILREHWSQVEILGANLISRTIGKTGDWRVILPRRSIEIIMGLGKGDA